MVDITITLDYDKVRRLVHNIVLLEEAYDLATAVLPVECTIASSLLNTITTRRVEFKHLIFHDSNLDEMVELLFHDVSGRDWENKTDG